VSYRVLHVTSSFPRHPGDPVAPFLLDLARAQAADGMRVTVVCPHDGGLPVRERFGDVEVVRARYGPAHFERLAYRGGLLATARDPRTAPLVPTLIGSLAVAARRVALDMHPDVVHAHWWFPGGFVALMVRNVPIVITLHGSDVGLAARSAVRPIAIGVGRRAAFVAAVSDPLLREARTVMELDPERSGVVRMPIAVDATHGFGQPEEGPPWRLVAVGRASPEKGFDVLLEAVHLARRDGTDVTLDIVGDGPDRAALEARSAQLGLAGAVRFLGPLPRAVLYERMAAAHAVVVPSRREGLGLVAVEALALGRPVIASRVGGLPEVVTAGTGMLVPPEDPAALAHALQSLPLPSPPANSPAVAAHAMGTVVAAHRAMYARAIATS
jgi:glycosyltransferase involved in cell wall biosynthesis